MKPWEGDNIKYPDYPSVTSDDVFEIVQALEEVIGAEDLLTKDEERVISEAREILLLKCDLLYQKQSEWTGWALQESKGY